MLSIKMTMRYPNVEWSVVADLPTVLARAIPGTVQCFCNNVKISSKIPEIRCSCSRNGSNSPTRVNESPSGALYLNSGVSVLDESSFSKVCRWIIAHVA